MISPLTHDQQKSVTRTITAKAVAITATGLDGTCSHGGHYSAVKLKKLTTIGDDLRRGKYQRLHGMLRR